MSKFVISAASAMFVPALAWAQPVTGPYVSLGAGVGLQQDEVALAAPALGRQHNNFWSFDAGFSGQASFGYGFGNGLRAELEGDFLTNDVNRYFPTATANQAHGTERKYGGMANVLYDLDVGLPVFPYAGLGIGGQAVEQDGFAQGSAGYLATHGGGGSETVGAFAYQAIVGAALPLAFVPGLSLTLEYRFLGLADPYPEFHRDATLANGATAEGKVRFSNDFNHSFLVGLRYQLFQPAPPPPPMAIPVAAPAPAATRTYLVFFDWDRADLTARARQIIAEAAQASSRVQVTRIAVNGYTDLSGAAGYNQALSIRRSRAVAAELVRDGVAPGAITAQGFGESNPLVPTAAGVREPQNRRVEILLQ